MLPGTGAKHKRNKRREEEREREGDRVDKEVKRRRRKNKDRKPRTDGIHEAHGKITDGEGDRRADSAAGGRVASTAVAMAALERVGGRGRGLSLHSKNLQPQ